MVKYEYSNKICSAAFKIIDFLMCPWNTWAMILMGHKALGMGPIIDIFYTLQILGCVPRTQVASSWWVPFEINDVHMMQDVAISESLVQVKHVLLCEYTYALK